MQKVFKKCVIILITTVFMYFLRKRFDQLKKEEDEKREGADKLGVGSRRSSMRRASTNLDKDKIKDRPKSMVTYEKGPPRDLGHNQKIDNREIGLSHES